MRCVCSNHILASPSFRVCVFVSMPGDSTIEWLCRSCIVGSYKCPRSLVVFVRVRRNAAQAFDSRSEMHFRSFSSYASLEHSINVFAKAKCRPISIVAWETHSIQSNTNIAMNQRTHAPQSQSRIRELSECLFTQRGNEREQKIK